MRENFYGGMENSNGLLTDGEKINTNQVQGNEIWILLVTM
jgi:hypothetical protein